MKACIVGSTGYAGQQLTTLLSQHPHIEKLYLGSFGSAEETLSQKYPHLKGVVDAVLLPAETLLTSEWVTASEIDVLFLALPHGMAKNHIPNLLTTGVRIIDLSADFRLQDPMQYAHWYGTLPVGIELDVAVYGLSEWNRQQIAGAQLIANPGCYATAALLAALPAVKAGLIGGTPLIIDGKSGISGAGRQGNMDNLFAEMAENVRPYQAGQHRHTPEIEQLLSLNSPFGTSVKLLFSPSVVPMTRGILCSVYAALDRPVTQAELDAIYAEFYHEVPFVRLTEREPFTKAVRGSNLADVWVHIDERTNTLVAMAAIDNLMKGAAGQAVQNMNLMMGYSETLGLEAPPLYP